MRSRDIKLVCRRTSTAVTLHLVDGAAEARESRSWANVTLNNDSLELGIQSDWGDWAYRWSNAGMPKHPDGRRYSLMEFLGSTTDDDYVARKLLGDRRYIWSPEASAARVRKLVLEMRREGRFTKDEARNAWDDCDELENAPTWDEFTRLMTTDLASFKKIVVWDHDFHEEEDSRAYTDLVGFILPAMNVAIADYLKIQAEVVAIVKDELAGEEVKP